MDGVAVRLLHQTTAAFYLLQSLGSPDGWKHARILTDHDRRARGDGGWLRRFTGDRSGARTAGTDHAHAAIRTYSGGIDRIRLCRKRRWHRRDPAHEGRTGL